MEVPSPWELKGVFQFQVSKHFSKYIVCVYETAREAMKFNAGAEQCCNVRYNKFMKNMQEWKENLPQKESMGLKFLRLYHR
jgi:hypothetical protein